MQNCFAQVAFVPLWDQLVLMDAAIMLALVGGPHLGGFFDSFGNEK